MLHFIKVDKNNLKRLGMKKDIFTFTPGVNVLVGNNGCGKSSLIEFMTKNPKGIEVIADPCQYRFFDFEKNNPRVLDPYQGNENLFVFNTASRMGINGSHGQLTKKIIKVIKKEPTEYIYIMDEPEQGLDFNGINELVDILINYINKGGQAIIATHSPKIILNRNFNIIELTPNYVQDLKQEIRNLYFEINE